VARGTDPAIIVNHRQSAIITQVAFFVPVFIYHIRIEERRTAAAPCGQSRALLTASLRSCTKVHSLVYSSQNATLTHNASADGNKRLPYRAECPTAFPDGNRRLPYCAVCPTAFPDGDRCFVCHLVLQSTYSGRNIPGKILYTTEGTQSARREIDHKAPPPFIFLLYVYGK